VVFKKLMQAAGVGGPQVETVLHNASTTPGGTITGEVTILGGKHDSEILGVNLALKTRVEIESGDNEYSSNLEYAKLPVAGAFKLDDGARYSVPFQMPIPWEAPLTHFYGQPLRGTTVGVATELEVARAVDATDLDPIAVHPLPAQERLLAAFAALGFQFRNADCEKGRIWGVHQELPFYQEIEFYPPAQYARGIKQIEVTFVSYPGQAGRGALRGPRRVQPVHRRLRDRRPDQLGAAARRLPPAGRPPPGPVLDQFQTCHDQGPGDPLRALITQGPSEPANPRTETLRIRECVCPWQNPPD
jgi:sporulation-control protein